MTACHIDAGLHVYIWNFCRTNSVDQILQLFEIDVAFKKMGARRVVGLINDYIKEGTAGQLLVRSGGSEIHIAWYHITSFDQRLRDNVFGPSPLMGRHCVLVTIIFLNVGL